MSKPAPVNELLEHRAANWLNGVMYFGLVSLVMLVALWSFLGSFGEVRAIIGASPVPALEAVPRESSGLFALLAAGLILHGWRTRQRSKKV